MYWPSVIGGFGFCKNLNALKKHLFARKRSNTAPGLENVKSKTNLFSKKFFSTKSMFYIREHRIFLQFFFGYFTQISSFAARLQPCFSYYFSAKDWQVILVVFLAAYKSKNRVAISNFFIQFLKSRN